MITVARPTARRVPPVVAGFLALSLLLMGQLQLSLAQGVVVADLATAVVVIWWIWVSPRDPGRDLARILLLPLLMVLVGSLMAFAPNGLAGWGVRDLMLDVAVIFTFFASYGAASQITDQQWTQLRRALFASLVLVTILLSTGGDGELRSAGSFPNPNLAAHFVVTVSATLAALSTSRRQRVTVIALGVVAWSFTGSFGALLQAAVTAGYALWKRPQRSTAAIAVAVAVLLAGGAWVAFSSGASTTGTVTVAGVSTDRLERSGEGRFEHWFDGMDALVHRPWGVGPGAVKALGYSENELHNEPLAYLVERGPLALMGLALVAITLWRHGAVGGPARALLLGFGAASFFRETSHYRHLWICLAIMLAWESRPAREGSS